MRVKRDKDTDIAVVLPPSEHFSPVNAGAISLCVRDFAAHSRFGDRITVCGVQVARPFDDVAFTGIKPRGLIGSRRRRYLGGLRAALADKTPRLIEIHNRPEFVARIARWFPRARLALHLHNDPQSMRAARSPRERRDLLALLDAVYCVSGHIRDRLLDGIDDAGAGDKVHVVHNGLDTAMTDRVMQGLERDDNRAHRDPVILFVGRVVADKGALLFVEGVARAMARLPGWRATMIGADRPVAGEDDAEDLTEYERKVHAAVDKINETAGDRKGMPAIELAGFMPFDQVLEAFGRAALAVVPSQWDEPFGRTALEAMAMGCPLIATPRGGLPEVMGDTGAMLTPDDPERLAALIVELANDGDCRAALGRAGRARAVAQFDIASVTGALDQTRSALLGADGGGIHEGPAI